MRKIFQGNPALEITVPLTMIIALVVVNSLLFNYFAAESYFHWYLENGVVIAFLVSFASLLWNQLEDLDEMISAHPLTYIEGCATVGMVVMLAFFADTHPDNRGHRRVLRSRLPFLPRTALWVDLQLALLTMLVLMILCFVWLLVVVPLNYFFILFTGALARKASLGDRVYRAIFTKK